MKSFTTCSRCGQPIMDDWHDCPYCKAYCKIKDVKPIAEAKLSGNIIAIAVAFAIFVASTVSFFAIDWKKPKHQNSTTSIKQSRPTQRLEKSDSFGDVEKLPIVVEYGDGQYETLEWCYTYVKNHPESATSQTFRYAWVLLEQGIAENIRDLQNVSPEDKSIIQKSLSYFEQKMPNKGCVLKSSGNFGQSPLRINTDAGGGYVVKIVDVDTKRVERLLFIPEYWEYEIDIPDGEYEIRYMIGSKWYGDKILFGNDCSCARADKTFTFHDGHGYTITLRKVKNGNLRTEDMRKEDF